MMTNNDTTRANIDELIEFVDDVDLLSRLREMRDATEIDVDEYVNVFRISSCDLCSFVAMHTEIDDDDNRYDVTNESRDALIAFDPAFASADFSRFDT